MEQHEPQRDYQRYMVMAINAERAAQGLTIKGMAERAGIHERTMLRVLALERDLDFAQVDAIAQALGVRVSDLVTEAERRRGMSDVVRPLSRGEVERFLAEPSTDSTLNAQLSEAALKSRVKGTALTQLLERVERLRRDELLSLLGVLDQAERPSNHNHGA